MFRSYLGPAVAAASLALPLPVLADDREPTPEERVQIENVLRAEGFVEWDDIEWDDDGYWSIDDAETADGKDYDLKLDQTFAVTEREED
jgi:hypothetical protein